MKSQKFSGKPKKPKFFVVRRVVGESMAPTLLPGKVVIAIPWFSQIKPGHIVVVHHDGIEKIKRVSEIAEGMLFIVGDNLSKSMDSRDFGWVSADRVVAKVIWPS